MKNLTLLGFESTEARRIKSLAQGENILMLGIEPSTFVSQIDILTTTPIVHVVHQLFTSDSRQFPNFIPLSILTFNPFCHFHPPCRHFIGMLFDNIIT